MSGSITNSSGWNIGIFWRPSSTTGTAPIISDSISDLASIGVITETGTSSSTLSSCMSSLTSSFSSFSSLSISISSK